MKDAEYIINYSATDKQTYRTNGSRFRKIKIICTHYSANQLGEDDRGQSVAYPWWRRPSVDDNVGTLI